MQPEYVTFVLKGFFYTCAASLSLYTSGKQGTVVMSTPEMVSIYNTRDTTAYKHGCHKLQPQTRPRSPADWSHTSSLRSVSSVFNTSRYQALLLSIWYSGPVLVFTFLPFVLPNSCCLFLAWPLPVFWPYFCLMIWLIMQAFWIKPLFTCVCIRICHLTMEREWKLIFNIIKCSQIQHILWKNEVPSFQLISRDSEAALVV